jgi:hypothetical protein
MLAEDADLCIDGTVGYFCFCLLHVCQLYYVLMYMDVKSKMQNRNHGNPYFSIYYRSFYWDNDHKVAIEGWLASRRMDIIEMTLRT